MHKGLAGRGVLVTGAGSSVGRLIAEEFITAGARAHVADISAPFIAEAIAAVDGLSGSVCDLSDPAQIEAMFASAQEAVGPIDFLVNCVGVAGPHAPLEEVDSTEWRAVFEANVHGFFDCMRLAIPGMKARRFGAIINFSSASTRTGLPSRTPYVASKAAVEALSYTAARELGPYGVRCNAILPGPIRNARMDSIIERNAQARGIGLAEMEEELLRHVSLRSRVEPDELAAMVLHLCSEAGRHITGEMIAVSGNVEWEE